MEAGDANAVENRSQAPAGISSAWERYSLELHVILEAGSRQPISSRVIRSSNTHAYSAAIDS